MEDNENIYDKLKELFGDLSANLNVLEEKIDMDVQMEYFELSKKLKKSVNSDEVLSLSDQLFVENIPFEDKKELLTKLAQVGRVEAYRLLEGFVSDPPAGLRDWSILALQENRMLLESKLLDENQIFISTGLGGKGTKLRYFVALVGKSDKPFSSFQKRIIKNEFEYNLVKYNSELEKIDYSDNIASVLAVVPMNKTIKSVFEEVINECNHYGDFLQKDFIITNVKELTFNEIRAYLQEQELNDLI